tara:strand:+ start:2385 stop:2732 length:348 start_codon:yes stop_codon:yes gene_type:complete
MKYVILTKKDLIAINQKFAEGYFENESSLDYALDMFKQNISWTKQLANLVRAILVDHVFTDGNKRTAYNVLLSYIEIKEYNIEEKKSLEIIKNIVLKNTNSIKKIQDMIENAITK